MSEETEAEKTETTASDKTAVPQKVPSLYHNYISFAGTAIAVAASACILLLLVMEFTHETATPYLELFTFILFPSILIFGLFVVLVGILYERRRRRRFSPTEIPTYPTLDLNDPHRRRVFLTFLCLAVMFIFVSAFGSYRAYEYTESVAFCGQQCHVVMKPEFVAYNASPHARVRCVECHVGGGAEAYARAKFTGVRQLYKVVTDTYDRPIHTPVHNMRAANETCGACHWSEKFHGEKLRIFNHYGYDEKNSLDQTRMLIKVGGGNSKGGETGGIHWHMNLDNEVTYISEEEKRQSIPWVRLKDRNGKVIEYMTKDAALSPEQIAQSPKRKMDCIDCHNRPTHIYLSPNKAVDQSFDAGALDASLPFLKSKAVEVLSQEYSTNDEAVNAIAANLDAYYRTNHTDVYSAKKDSIDSAAKELQRIYQTYFFPEMKTDWRAHPNNIGHFNAQGCFRCHDGQHFSREGQVIRNDCNICHTTLDRTRDGKTVPATGGAFQHPVNLGDKNTWQCAACHKGDRAFKHPLNLGDISQFQCADCHKGQTMKLKW